LIGPLPTVIVHVLSQTAELDACLASLTAHLPSRASVMLHNNHIDDPKIVALLNHWSQRQSFSVEHIDRREKISEVDSLNKLFAQLNNDVLMLQSSSIVTPGWLDAIWQCAKTHPMNASVTPWSNNGGLVSFPRSLDSNEIPDDLNSIASAAVAIKNNESVQLPLASSFCCWLSREAISTYGALDSDTFTRFELALHDWCRRVSSHGRQHLMCYRSYVANATSVAEEMPAESEADMDRLLARWPDYHERVAQFILQDPLREWRDALQQSVNQHKVTSQQATSQQGLLF
jgi:hypothetical protein